EPIAVGTLREVAAKMGAEAAEDHAEFVVAVAVLLQPADHEEAAPGGDLFTQAGNIISDAGKREFVPLNRLAVGIAALELSYAGIDLLDRARRQRVDPILGPGQILAEPDGSSIRAVRHLKGHGEAPGFSANGRSAGITLERER